MFNQNKKIGGFSFTQLVSIIVFALILNACGESKSGNDDESGDEITRILNDSPVNGVNYTCDGKTDVTKNGGEFKCIGAPVTFSIGGLTIGTITDFNADNQVFPQDFSLVSRDDFSDEKTIKIARLLQSLDEDGDISQSIDIPSSIANKFLALVNIDDLTLEQLGQMAEVDLVTKPYAISHLRRTLNGGEDRSDYIIQVDIADANSGSALTTDVSLLIKGAEVLNADKTAARNITLNGIRKVTTLYLKNLPEVDQDIKVIVTAKGYIDSGVSITLSEAQKIYNLNLNLVKDEEGVLANGVFASAMVVSNKVNNSGMVTEDIVLENKEATNKPGVKISIPSGTVLTDKNGEPVVGAKLKITGFDPYQSDAIAAYPGGLNVMADASGFNIGGEPQVGETSIAFKSAGFAAISIVDDAGNKVKNFSNDIEVAMQFAIGTKDGDGNVVAIGDAVPIWSYDEDTGKWSYEKEGTVQDLDLTDGLYDVVYSLNHLSYWNVDWNYGEKCAPSRAFVLKNAANDFYQVKDFNFHLILQSAPAINITLPGYGESTFVEFFNVPANTPGVLEVWTRGNITLLASTAFGQICSGADIELEFEYDSETYGYDEAIEVLDSLDNAVDKTAGVRPITDQIDFVITVADLLSAEGESRGEELLTRVSNTMLSYSAAFIGAEGYQGVTPDIYGCDVNQFNFIDELVDNFYYQSVFNGPLADSLNIEVLPYLETAANVFIAHSPSDLAYAPYGLRGFIDCGFKIVKGLSDFGDESDLATLIYEHFEDIIIFSVASMKVDIELELASSMNGKISYPSAVTFLYIINQALTIAEELVASGFGFTTDSLSALNAAKAYYDDLEATGKIDEFCIGELCPQ